MIASQLGKLFGISVGVHDFFAVAWDVLSSLNDANGPTVLLSAVLLGAALLVKRFLPIVPASLVVAPSPKSTATTSTPTASSQPSGAPT